MKWPTVQRGTCSENKDHIVLLEQIVKP
jgi:hypothetical protein